MADQPCEVAVLLKAADIMEQGGMLRGDRGSMISAAGPHCALGAIDAASNLAGVPYDCRVAAQNRLADILRSLIPVGVYDTYNDPDKWQKPATRSHVNVIATWNNMIAKDAKEVASAMRLAAMKVAAAS